MLVTVVNVEGQVTCDTLSSKLAEYSKSDDVWNEVGDFARPFHRLTYWQSFLEAMVLSTSSSFNVDSDVASCAEQLGTSLIVKNGNATSELSGIGLALVNGPQVREAEEVEGLLKFDRFPMVHTLLLLPRPRSHSPRCT